MNLGDPLTLSLLLLAAVVFTAMWASDARRAAALKVLKILVDGVLGALRILLRL